MLTEGEDKDLFQQVESVCRRECKEIPCQNGNGLSDILESGVPNGRKEMKVDTLHLHRGTDHAAVAGGASQVGELHPNDNLLQAIV